MPVTKATSVRIRFSLALLAAMTASLPASLAATTTSSAAKPAAKTQSQGTPEHYLPNRFAGQAGRYYRLIWGIDSLDVKTVESGEIVRFSWRVLDPQLAAILADKRSTPSLEDPEARVQLVVPSMEQIGQLRQSSAPEVGKSYWMAFSNKGRVVKSGHRVNVVIGSFRAEGLVVD